MSDIVAWFGRTVQKQTNANPAHGRSLLLAGYRAAGIKLQFFPDRRLPPSRQFGAAAVNRVMCRVTAHPEQAALVSVFMPCELLEALDILPMCAELYAAFINGSDAEASFAQTAEEQGIPESYCSYHKVLLGCAYSGLLPPPAVIVNTSLVCDANNLSFRELSNFYGVPQYYVDVPPERSEASVTYVAEQLRDLAIFLENHTNRKLDPDRLCAIMERSRDTVALLKKCYFERSLHSLPGDLTAEMYEIYLTHNALGSEAALRYAETLYADLKSAPPAHGFRLLWLHTIPIWQTPVRELFDFSDRCQIVCVDMNLESLIEVDPEKPYESMARRLVYSHWNGGEERIQTAVQAAKDLSVNGVICFCHWGCKQTMGLSAVMKQRLEAEGFPTLILNGDGCDRRNASDGQTATRLHAFMEMLGYHEDE